MLMMCGVFYMCLSCWAIVQMIIMGLLYKIESTSLIEDAEEHHFSDVEDFIKKTKANYTQCAINCFIAAGIYVVILLLSFAAMSKAKEDNKRREAKLLDDSFAVVVEKELTEKEKKKIK